MKKREILDLVSAFAVVGLIIGILITAFAKDNTTASDAGKVLVIVTFLIAAVCQIIIWMDRRR